MNMEAPVWIQWFAQVAAFVSSLFASSSKTPAPSDGGASRSALESGAISTSTSLSPTILAVIRDPALATNDALFGTMEFDGRRLGITMERTAVAIPEGTYQGCKRWSQHFGMTVVGIIVPSRTDIECHPANLPSQLLGCIAIGESKDGDALDNSRAAFDGMMAAVPKEFTVEISSL
jgi:hypothetical protein